ncbi:unnamed protein product [Acanthoscelides obtectus]|uniref:Uncharacterized protein n=1 Tax=Acanthoscelides obtectus TaxID=200917 RepID=A0A9P0M9C7_ACAOB|nr:unnamed protein product [Acanthoscelides obtectus]CAK1647809.1 hypothetical protein AOBTE_LOCUS15406 [Acanthoscelides obtectus]
MKAIWPNFNFSRIPQYIYLKNIGCQPLHIIR